MALLQWLALAILLSIFASFAFLYIRHGTKVRTDPDHNSGDGNITQGGAFTGTMDSGGDAGGSSE